MVQVDNHIPQMAMVRASVLTPLRQELANNGLFFDGFLRRHGIRAADLADPYANLPLAGYLALFEDAAAKLGDESLGLKLGMRIRPSDIGPIGVLFSMSTSLQVAFERLAKYVKALQEGTLSSLTPSEQDFIWHYSIAMPGLWPRRQDAEFTLTTCCQLARSCFYHNWRPLEVHFEHPAGNNALLMHKFFRAPVYFNQSGNRFIVDGATARRNYRSEDPGLTYILERHLLDLMERGGEIQSVRESVARLIEQNMGQKPVSISSIAFELGMTPRTLQRRLLEEGAVFREMVQTHRNTLAKRLLADKNASMGDVAQALGYADRTAFWRAYKRWEGKMPSRR